MWKLNNALFWLKIQYTKLWTEYVCGQILNYCIGINLQSIFFSVTISLLTSKWFISLLWWKTILWSWKGSSNYLSLPLARTWLNCWKELIAYSPLIWHRPDRKRVQPFFYWCVCIFCHGNTLSSHCLAKIGGIHIKTQSDGRDLWNMSLRLAQVPWW